jgi:2-polyprenyl-3-methyl-5-hydroxy-6-metoxy-1,4-benzoquinol methylase
LRYHRLTDIVRAGGESPDQSTVRPNYEGWVDFARSMAPMMAPAAEAIAKHMDAAPPAKVLDIAAGHGLFGIAIARHNPDAQIFALDWAAVLEVAKENAAKAGVAERYHTIEGSAFEADFGSDYDLILVTNFLHHFDPPTCESFLKRVRAALKPGGRVVTLEMVPNEDRISPPVAAAFSLIMLAGTERGDAYTFAELDRMLRNAGFERNHFHALPAGPEALVISEK